MKKAEWVTGNKMRFESLHKEFNRQTNYIGTGNVIANTQVSGFIRGRLDNGHNLMSDRAGHYPPGELQEHDLRPFNVPEQIKDWIRHNITGKESVILYKFFYYVGETQKPIGYVVTTPKGKLLRKWSALLTAKAMSALELAIEYITE